MIAPFTYPKAEPITLWIPPQLCSKYIGPLWEQVHNFFQRIVEASGSQIFIPVDSEDFQAMTHILDIESHQSNPRYVCFQCWSILTRHGIAPHRGHRDNIVPRGGYSCCWGNKKTTTGNKLIELAKKGGHTELEGEKVVGVRLLSYNWSKDGGKERNKEGLDFKKESGDDPFKETGVKAEGMESYEEKKYKRALQLSRQARRKDKSKIFY